MIQQGVNKHTHTKKENLKDLPIYIFFWNVNKFFLTSCPSVVYQQIYWAKTFYQLPGGIPVRQVTYMGLYTISLASQIRLSAHSYLDTNKVGIGKQCRPRSDATNVASDQVYTACCKYSKKQRYISKIKYT